VRSLAVPPHLKRCKVKRGGVKHKAFLLRKGFGKRKLVGAVKGGGLPQQAVHRQGNRLTATRTVVHVKQRGLVNAWARAKRAIRCARQLVHAFILYLYGVNVANAIVTAAEEHPAVTR